MTDLHLSYTATSQWQELIQDAQKALAISLDEELESYLVFLLIRFTKNQTLTTTPIAIEWLTSLNEIGQKRQHSLRDVGDKCLIYSGLFPGIARKRMVPISYFVHMGKSAYLALSASQENSCADLFLQLHESFVPIMDILHTTREIENLNAPSLDLLQAKELWKETGSTHAKRSLEILRSRNIGHLPPSHPFCAH